MEEYFPWMPRFRNRKHWTRQYIKDRLRRMEYEFFHPSWPWLPRAAVEYIRPRLLETDIGIEFGSGRSTVWLGKRLRHLVTTEHSTHWMIKTTDAVRRNGITHKVHIFATKQHYEYLRLISRFPDNHFNFCLVDSGPRDECITGILPKLKNGAWLVLDNAERYLPINSRAPEALHAYASPLWEEFSRQVASWPYKQFSDGITDTIVWKKP